MQNSQTTSSLHTTCFWIASSIVLEPTINTLLHIQYIAQKLYVILFIWSIPCKTKSECNCEKWRLHNTPIRTVTHSCHLFTNTHTTLPSPPKVHTFPNTLTHAAVSMSLIAAGTGVVRLAWGVAHTSRDLVGWVRGRDYWGRARETQVAAIMVEALHLTLTRLWDSFTFIYVWEGKGNMFRDLELHFL